MCIWGGAGGVGLCVFLGNLHNSILRCPMNPSGRLTSFRSIDIVYTVWVTMLYLKARFAKALFCLSVSFLFCLYVFFILFISSGTVTWQCTWGKSNSICIFVKSVFSLTIASMLPYNTAPLHTVLTVQSLHARYRPHPLHCHYSYTAVTFATVMSLKHVSLQEGLLYFTIFVRTNLCHFSPKLHPDIWQGSTPWQVEMGIVLKMHFLNHRHGI